MKKLFTISFILFFWAFSEADAQQSFETEFYGGPAVSHFNVEMLDPESMLTFGSPVGGHVGLNLMAKLNSNWQLSGQVEYFRSSWRYTAGAEGTSQYFSSAPTIARANSAVNFGLGLRYNHQVKNKIIYVQGGLGSSNNQFRDYFNQRFEDERSLHLTFRAEAGVKIYNKKGNYFTLGVRHQQGLNRDTRETLEPPFNGPANIISHRGSFTGLFVGYGIGTKSKKSIF